MESVELIAVSENKIKLGSTCEYRLKSTSEGIQLRAFLKYSGLFYLKPIRDWSSEKLIRIFPEAPGDYTLLVEWKNLEGKKGWLQADFKVAGDVLISNRPKLIKAKRGLKFWIPSEWEARLFVNYEQPVFDLLDQIVRPGWVIYDVGANIGYYSLMLSRIIGERGHVYCIEANPLCVYFLLANFQENNAKNFTILPGAASDHESMINFTINYANSGLGVTQPSNFYGSKVGHEFGVQGYCLDDLVEAFNLRSPNLVKIDVEGSEDTVLTGMERILEKYRPTILLEVHGNEAAKRTFPKFHGLNYRFKVINGQEFKNEDEILGWFPDSVLQLVCYP